MTEKITITQEQADSINWILSAQSIDELIVAHARSNGGYVGRAKALKGMSAIKLTKALRVGYEVEQPPLRVGDWATRIKTTGSGMSNHSKGYTFQIQSFAELTSEKHAVGNNDWTHKISNLRHSTPEEIKAEEERQKWAGIEEGDVLIGKKSGTLAVFVMDFPEHSEVKVRVRNYEFQTWDKESVELYAKKVNVDA